MGRDAGPPRGILRHAPGPGAFHHARVAPSPALAEWIQHFWIVRWDLRGLAPQVRETLPHPNVHLVLEPGKSRIHGVHSGRFTAALAGQGGVFGVKFRPGGFRPFYARALSALRDRSLPPREVFGPPADALESEVLAQATDEAMIAKAEDFLAARMPPADPVAKEVGEMVDGIAVDRSLTSVEELARRHGLHQRRLQRLFNEYVGVSPKWVINRYRLHEAIERLAGGGAADWAQVALDLGYFDQAHFIRDFRKLVGRSPGEYAR